METTSHQNGQHSSQQPTCYEVCRWIADHEPKYSNEIISCGKRGQVIVTCDTLKQAQDKLDHLASVGTSFLSLYFINGVYA